MKFIISLLLFITSFYASAFQLEIPKGYEKIQSGNSVDLYRSVDDDVYVQVVNLQSGGIISLDGFSPDDLNKYPSKSSKNKSYLRRSIVDLYSYYSYGTTLFSVINGQFFDNGSDYTKLAFPVKSGEIVKSTEKWENLKFKTFVIDKKDNARILDGYKSDYLNNKTYKEVFVALNPKENKNPSFSIGRNFLGIYSTSCTTQSNCSKFDYVLFFIAKNESQGAMIDIAIDWGIDANKNLAMLDGSGSSQIVSGKYSLYGSRLPWILGYDPDYRKIPHSILIYDSQNKLYF